MTAENGVCFYALHIGCPNVADSHCRRCAEGLTNAVNQIPQLIADKH